MLSIETISQRLADAKGKRERLISTLNRHISALEKKEREFEKTYKLKPELCSEESLRGNDKAFWDFFSIKSKKSDILSVNKRIQEAEERIRRSRLNFALPKHSRRLWKIRFLML